MSFILMIFLALLLGLVATGIVWYGWGIVENVMAFLNRPRPKSADDDTEEVEPAENS